MTDDGSLFECDTEFDHYKVADTIYSGRPARVLYGGNGETAQSGLAKDDKKELLFDYNERFMEIVRGVRPRDLLLIGGGAFTMPMALQQQFPKLSLDVVELDPKLLEIAGRFFGYKPGKNTHTYIGDGQEFINTVDHVYDMIVLDVFVQADIPEQFRSMESVQSMKRHLHKKGVLAINVIGSLKGRRSVVMHRLHETLQAIFPSVEIFPASGGLSEWTGQNFILTAQTGTRELETYLRYAPVK